MPVKIRLSRKGRKKAPFYHIIIADSRSPRDGKFIEKIGTYNPMTKPATIEIDRNAAFDWLQKGAQPTDTVKAILRFKGVYYKKHLLRGVSKGAMTQDQADTLWQNWIDSKESKIDLRRAQTIADLEAFRKSVSGEAKKVKVAVADAETREAAEVFKTNTEEKVIEEVESPVESATTETAAEVQIDGADDASNAAAEEDVVTEIVETPEEISENLTEDTPEVEEEIENVTEVVIEEPAGEVTEDINEVINSDDSEVTEISEEAENTKEPENTEDTEDKKES